MHKLREDIKEIKEETKLICQYLFGQSNVLSIYKIHENIANSKPK